jgi:hypothetical protein
MLGTLVELPATTGTSTAAPTPSPTETPSPTVTPVISPTPTPPSTIPSGQDLLARVATAFTTKNTVHVTQHWKLQESSRERQVINSQSDFSTKPRLEHSVVTTRTTRLDRKSAKTTTQREEIIIVKKREATKTGKKPWRCSAAPKASGTDPASGGSGIPATSRSVTNLGAETVGTVPVWHVREVDTLDILGQSLPVTLDFYIAQSDFTLVRVTESDSVTDSGKTATSTLVANFTRYGETVKATLPAACAGR